MRLNAHGGYFCSGAKIPTLRKQHCKAYRMAALSPGLHDSGRLGTYGNTEKHG